MGGLVLRFSLKYDVKARSHEEEKTIVTSDLCREVPAQARIGLQPARCRQPACGRWRGISLFLRVHLSMWPLSWKSRPEKSWHL